MSRVFVSVFCAILAVSYGDLRAEGLISRLSSDGSRAKYDLQSTVEMEADGPDLAGHAIPKAIHVLGTISLSSVGRARIDQQECRWIEIGREIPDQKVKSVLKLLIPEKNFGRGEDPLAHVLRMENWNQSGMVQEPEPIVGLARKRYEIERFRGMIPERLHDVKPLGKRVIRTPLGPIECEGKEGTAELAPSHSFRGQEVNGPGKRPSKSGSLTNIPSESCRCRIARRDMKRWDPRVRRSDSSP